MAHRAPIAAAIAVAVLAACDDGPPVRDGGTPVLELGTGGIGVFEPISDGDTVRLARGCQGSQHVWISLRANDIDTSPGLVELLALRELDMVRASLPFLVRLTFNTVAGARQLSGLALVIPDPAVLVGQTAILRARVSEATPGGASVQAERRVRIEWGAEVCGVLRDGSVGDAGPATDASTDGGAADAATDGGTPDAAPLDAP